MDRLRVRVRGQVQGVGFRPFVHALAARLELSGWVLNDGDGVLLEVQGAAAGRFVECLRAEAPPLARIDALEAAPVPPEPSAGFAIRDSRRGGPVRTGIPPDAAVCPDCLAELCDPADRRWRYPFLTCTRCGPRFTLTRALPYDRPQTAMAGFPLCADCAREYQDPADRRFHAQPIACPACGPRLSHPVATVLAELAAGRIVALKGLGGFHLVCDARDGAAVARLRRVKQRNDKPFAVMVAGLAGARRLGTVGPAEAALLESPERPIVLLRRTEAHDRLPDGIAPGLAWLGVMLPYTPLHYLLFHEAAGWPAGIGWLDQPQSLVLVMTSANPGGEPLVIGNAEAAQRLAGIADLIVDHDRDILVRCDDSVMRVVGGVPQFLRRARGFVPAPVHLPAAGPSVLAVGAALKTTLCLTRGAEAFPSQHIGDLDTAASLAFLEETAAHLRRILEIEPVRVAHDLHPDVPSTRFARSLGLPCVPVQHHHAHVAAVLAEHGRTGPAVGLALDGFGLGDDGTAWGGELLRVDGAGFERLGHLARLRQPGGDAAARQPWRMAAAALHALGRTGEITALAGPARAGPLLRMLDTGVNAPWTSSAGRWFDAACGLLGVRSVAGFEGEAPMALESLVSRPAVLAGGWAVRGGVLDLLPLLDALRGLDPGAGADLFHGTLTAALVDWAAPVLAAQGLGEIVLGGGCLQNQVLAEGLAAGFAARGIAVLTARRVPPGDGGLSLGQAWVALQAAL